MTENVDTGRNSGGPGVFHQDWTQGGIMGNLLRLSWPMVITLSLIHI